MTKAEVERLTADLGAAGQALDNRDAELAAALAEVRRVTQLYDQLVKESTVREEWLVTGEPADGYHPPYRFVFGGPNEGDQTGTPEERARKFINFIKRGTTERHGWLDGPHLHRRTITETEWVAVDTVAADAVDVERTDPWSPSFSLSHGTTCDTGQQTSSCNHTEHSERSGERLGRVMVGDQPAGWTICSSEETNRG